MRSPLCDKYGIEFPLFGFSHCRDVVVEVSKAGGMGIFGASAIGPGKLEAELAWIDEHIDGRPYGVDLVLPAKFEAKGEKRSRASTASHVPDSHKDYVNRILNDYDVPEHDYDAGSLRRGARLSANIQPDGANAILDVAFAHPIAMIINALGTPPAYLMERARAEGVPVGALVGASGHAVKQVAAGVDALIVVGGEAGGHCGSVSTMVLVPEVAAAAKAVNPDVAVLAAGGIVTGRQMAGAMAMGADGAWTGSVWLTTPEAETSPVVKEKMLAAGSGDTVRARTRTGKPARQLRTAWTDAWDADDAPAPLPMPLQSIVTEPPMARVTALAEGGHKGAQQLATYFVGQGVGMMNREQSTRSIVQDFMEDFLSATERLSGFTSDLDD